MQIKSRVDLFSELKKTNQFEGWIKGKDLCECKNEMKAIQTSVYRNIGIWIVLCVVFTLIVNFIFNTRGGTEFLIDSGLRKTSWFFPTFLFFLGLSGLILIIYTDKAFRKIRQVRSLHLLPVIFAALQSDKTYLLFLSIKGVFHADFEKKDLDTWLVLYNGNKEGRLLTLTDQSWVKSGTIMRDGKTNYKFKERVFSFMQIFHSTEVEALKFTQSLLLSKKKENHPIFPSKQISQEIFNDRVNKFRDFNTEKLMEGIEIINENPQ